MLGMQLVSLVVALIIIFSYMLYGMESSQQYNVTVHRVYKLTSSQWNIK